MNKTQKQVLRMLALVPYLQDHDGIPVATLAEQFNVTRRQIQDDLQLLTLTGVGEFHGELIDLDYDALESSGIARIRDAEFMNRPLRLLTREAIALIVALRALRAGAGPQQVAIIDSALRKLDAAVGSTDAPVDVHVSSGSAEVLDTLERALAAEVQVRLTYASPARDAATERVVEPRRLVTDAGQVYLEAWCQVADDLRSFRLDRVIDVEILDQPVTIREVAAASPLDELFTPPQDGPYVVVDIDEDATWMIEYYRAEVLDPARRRVRIRGGDPQWLVRLVLARAESVRVVEPASIARAVADEARLSLSAYS